MSDPANPRPTYEGGFPALLQRYEQRRAPLVYGPGEALPPLDVDLAALRDRPVLPPEDDPDLPRSGTSFSAKRVQLRKAFRHNSELLYLHGMLIANLRRRAFPDHAPALFHRLWAEEAPFLLAHLNLRWQVSAVTTFAEHGPSAEERRLATALSTLLNTMKLYEFERLWSGRGPEQPFPLKARHPGPLPLEMEPYALQSGGLDVNMLAPLWRDAQDAPVLGPLARQLLEALMTDPGTIFRRLRRMAVRQARRRARRDAAE